MPGPAPSLVCPCGRAPRRAKGKHCNLCTTAYQKARRAELRAGSAHKVRAAHQTAPRFHRSLDAQRYLITSAQNATPVHAEFLEALKVAARHLKAELVVIPLRYKNPTSQWTQKQDDQERWDPAVVPFLFNQRKKLGPNLVLVADFKIQPTASSPLTGLESVTGAESCIVGHPKMQFTTVASPSGRFPKLLSTTGSVTRRNFTDSKAGKLGAFHHCLGAVVVELKGRGFRLRQINADRSDGSFTDLENHYTAKGVRKAPPALALALGDTHARFTCPDVDRATFGPGGIVEVLDPEAVIFHDLFDGYSVNHHHKGDPFIAQAKASAQLSDVRAEVEHAVEFVRSRCAGRKAVIVASNHDNFLSRWIRETDWRFSGSKAFYLETAAAMLASAKIGPGGAEYADPFAHWVEKLKGKAAIRCLAAGESYSIAGVECGMHGDKGPNGARGSVRNLSKIGTRAITGHGHSPAIENGHYRTGTSTPLQLEYSRGSPGSWLNAHVVIYASGKRSLLIIVDGEWRL